MKEVELLKKPLFWLALLLVLVWVAIFQLPDNKLHLVFCDVGQGDAILISYRATQVLVDGGPNNKVLNCLAENMPFWDRTVEMVVLTHPQADHFTGLIDVIERYRVEQFVINSIVYESAGFWEFYQALLAEEAKIYSPQAGDKIRLGPIQFLVFWPKEELGDSRMWLASQGDTSDGDPKGLLRGGGIDERKAQILGAVTYSGNLNETSIVLKLSFGSFDAFLTGDIGVKTESQLDLSDIQVLKVAHHGSKYSTSEEFLKQAQPELAVISVGKNRFGHPTNEVIKRIRELGIRLLRTDQEGEIEIISDGKNWRVKR